MTTTTTTHFQHPASRRIRRDLAAALAGAALLASTVLFIGRVTDAGSSRAVAPITNPSTADLNLMNGAIHVFTPPEVVPTVVSPQTRLVINDEMSEACSLGFADACPYTHTWVPVERDSTSPAAMPACGGEFGWVCAVADARVG